MTSTADLKRIAAEALHKTLANYLANGLTVHEMAELGRAIRELEQPFGETLSALDVELDSYEP